ncbi:MAG: superinfection immunity protein [bacterium]|nr:superinfection immunity protein [bacterium]
MSDGWGVFYCICFLIYFIPTFVAFSRDHENKGWITLVNIIIGWTGLGWLAVLLWAGLGNKAQRIKSSNEGSNEK